MIATARFTQNIQKYFTFRETIIILICKYLLPLNYFTENGQGGTLWCLCFLLMRDKGLKDEGKGLSADFLYIQL